MPAPEKPAMSSGPGSLSQRTDGGPASKQAVRYAAGMPNYGDGQDFLDIQSSAPMAATPSVNPMSAGAVAEAATSAPVTPLGAPSEMAHVPVTDGADAGPGNDSSALNLELLKSPEAIGYRNALALLNQLGDAVSPQVAAIRNSLAAHLNNEAGKQ
jgi:hypothetical protein